MALLDTNEELLQNRRVNRTHQKKKCICHIQQFRDGGEQVSKKKTSDVSPAVHLAKNNMNSKFISARPLLYSFYSSLILGFEITFIIEI